MTTKTIVALISDTHIGSTTALSLPTYTTDEGQEIKATKAQEWLYERWIDFWGYVKTAAGITAKKRSSRLVIVHLGDVVDGLHHNTPQAMPNLADQENMACDLLRPAVAIADGFYMIRGTEAHAGLAAQSEVRIARELGAKACEYELDLDVDGLLMNFSHHGRAGARPWTSSASQQAAELVQDRAVAGQPIPRFLFRGHKHTLDDSGERIPGCRAIVLPAWQLKTAFGHRIAPGRRSDIGGLLVFGEMIDFSHARFLAQPGSVVRMTA